ncbi:MAG: histidine--tRNA ligase, partial [Nanoarchaeota archaeon]|nr:histidine--tRNA ligase [Nanoarchaeota archaeon]
VEPAALESMKLLTCKSGEEIKKQIFILEKRSKEEIGLRFELTASMARMFVKKQKCVQKPVKWFALSRMWRYEQPQAGRLREFYQFSAELFGSSKPQADAEVISFLIKCLTDLGLTEKDFVVRLNNRKLIHGMLLDFIQKEKIEAVFSEIDKFSKLSKGEIEGNLRDLGVDDDQIESVFDIILTEDIGHIDPKNNLAAEGLNELALILNNVDSKFVELDLTTVRGLAYYTGTVFEIFDRGGKLRSIAGGGRYDNMIKIFGGEPSPAIGFGIGLATLNLLLQEKGILPKPDTGCDYFIAPVSIDVVDDAAKIAAKLRTTFRVEMDLMGRKLGKQLAYADSIGAKNALIIGEDELKSGKLKVRNLSSGEEKKCTVDELLDKA